MDVLTSAGVPWFPQDYAETFYVAKGAVALVATLLLIFHMQTEWPAAMTWGRRLRYISLLYVAMLLTYSSIEQVNDAALVSYRNLGGIVASVLILVAAVVSICEGRRKP